MINKAFKIIEEKLSEVLIKRGFTRLSSKAGTILFAKDSIGYRVFFDEIGKHQLLAFEFADVSVMLKQVYEREIPVNFVKLNMAVHLIGGDGGRRRHDLYHAGLGVRYQIISVCFKRDHVHVVQIVCGVYVFAYCPDQWRTSL